MIIVASWGIGTSVRDAGRLGLAHLGRSRGGAADRASLALANRLVGNPEDHAGFETSGGLCLDFDTPTMVALTGALVASSVTNGPPVGWGAPTVLPAGATLRLGALLAGARCYLAVRGGVGRAGVRIVDDRIDIGPDPQTPAAIGSAPRWEPSTTIRVWPGPRLGRFTANAWSILTSTPFTVGVDSNRVGVRLDGGRLVHADTSDLPSEAVLEGAIQVPPDGRPIVMLADHPTTGGYPVAAIVDPADIGHVAQAAPGTVLRFRPA